MSVAPITLTDPTTVPTYGDGPLSRWCKGALYDPRDEVFVRLTLRMIVIMSVAMVGLWRYFRWSSRSSTSASGAGSSRRSS